MLRQIKNILAKSDFASPVNVITRRGVHKQFTFWIIVILLAGCSPTATLRPGAVYREETVVLPTGAPTPKPSPSSTRVTPLEIFTPGATRTITPMPDEIRGMVVKVIDGDTIAVILDGDPPDQTYLVRYIGIDAPPNTPDEPWGVVAYETNRKMTNFEVVRLVRDKSNFDDEGYLLRYVYIGDELMSIILTERGLARAAIVEPDSLFQAEIEEAEARARDGKLGLWGKPPTPTTPPEREPTISEEEEQEVEAEPEENTPQAETTTPTATTISTATAEPEGPTETSTTTPSANKTKTPGAATATEESSTITPEVTPQPTTEGDTGDSDELQGPQ